MLLVDDLAAGGTKNLRHTPRGLVTLVKLLTEYHLEFLGIKGTAQRRLSLYLSKCNIVTAHLVFNS